LLTKLNNSSSTTELGQTMFLVYLVGVNYFSLVKVIQH